MAGFHKLIMVVVQAGAAALLCLAFLEGAVPLAKDAYSNWSTLDDIKDNWRELSEEGGSVRRSPGSVALVEFGDYQCPGCRLAHQRLEALFDELAPDRRVVFRHLPLENVHIHARAAALASICAEAQGVFQEMHSHLLSDLNWEVDPDWTAEARAAGVPDLQRFTTCLESSEAEARLERDLALASRLGVRGTPTFVGPEGISFGVPSEDWLRQSLAGR